MLDAIRSRVARIIAPPAVRRFDAGSHGRRTTGYGSFHRTGPEVAAAATTVRSRARYLAANNPFVRNGVDNAVAALVGSGITATGEADVVRRFNAWSDVADADERTDFAGLQTEVARSLIVDGEAFVRMIVDADGFRLQMLPAELIDESHTTDLQDGSYSVNGVEFNSIGQRVAYHVLRARPTDQWATYSPPVRVPVADILHIFRPIGVGQARGISWLAPIVAQAAEFDAIVDALAVGVKVAALHAGFLVDQNNSGALPVDGDQRGSILESGLEPGTLRVLPAGMDIRFSSPQQANEVASFLRFNLQALAAGLGVPEHMLSGDLTGANYSSLRAGLLPFRARMEQCQWHVLVPQFLNPVWRRFALIEGLDAPVTWLPPAWQQVDPQKAVEATVAEINAGLTSRTKAVAERGWSIDELDAEIAADHAREAALDLNFSTPEKEPENGPPPADS